jgi:hypothetical protein
MATIAIVYGGPSQAVDIAETDQDAERGTPVDVDEAVASATAHAGRLDRGEAR